MSSAGSAKRRGPIDWNGPLQGLPGIGPKTAAALAENGIETPLDLALTLPSSVSDLSAALTVDAVHDILDDAPRAHVTVTGRVVRVTSSFFGRRRTTRVTLGGATAKTLRLHYPFFSPSAAKLVEGATVVAVGPLHQDGKGHPFLLAPRLPEAPFDRSLVEYSSVLGAGKAAFETLVREPGFPSLLPTSMAEPWAISKDALLRAHLGASPSALEEARRAAHFSEAAARVFLRATEPPARAKCLPSVGAGERMLALRRCLSVEPTADQQGAIDDVTTDLAGDTPMMRLVLGDVGTGKTLVALAAVLQCVRAGARAVVFAPTTALADQWVASLTRLTKTDSSPIAVRVVTGESRHGTTARWDVAVGTHALVAKAFRDEEPSVALVIVDEPQRTGTRLRETLKSLGSSGDERAARTPHLLLLTATPLPRTLALSDDGVLATSLLRREGRASRDAGAPITRVVPDATLEARLLDTVAPALERGERAFVVVPRVRASTAAAPGMDEVYERIARTLPHARVKLVHAGLSREAQRSALTEFREGRANLLFATTLVEVGLDVPEATTMVIMAAERFGVSQLHQLRGRVGRGAVRGQVLLVHGPSASLVARKRLEALAAEASGEAVARTDLVARGPGVRLGIEQSGGASVTDVTLPSAVELLRAVERLISDDPSLEHPDSAGFARVVARAKRGLTFEAAG